MASGLAMLETLEADFEHALLYTNRLCHGIAERIVSHDLPAQVVQCGTMFGVFFSREAIYSLADVQMSDLRCFKRYFWGMLKAGVYIAPSQFEANFVSAVHDETTLHQTLQAVDQAFVEVKSCLL